MGSMTLAMMTEGGTETSGNAKVARWIFPPYVGVIAMLGVAVTLFVWWSYANFGDIRSSWFYLNGYHLIAEEYQVELGKVVAGESVPVTFRLKNLTGKTVFLLGIKSDCSCLATAELPIEIPGGSVFGLEMLFQAEQVDIETEVVRWSILNLNVDQPIRLLEIRAVVVP